MEKNIFISVVYGVLDIRQATLTLARAGHCPVARVKPGGEARFLRTPGLGLGLDRGPLFRKVLVEELISLEAGDTFVFYTDGVVESRNEQGEEYGYDRFLQALREHHNKSVYPLHMALLEDLNQFIGSATYDDDMTMLVIKWEDHPAPPSSDGATTVTMPRTSKIG